MLRIDSREVDGVTVLDLTGHLIVGQESQSLSQRVKQLVAEHKVRILIAAQGVSFIDSCGVGELVSSYTSLKKNGGVLKLAAPQKMVREVLRIARIPTIVETFDTEAEALESFKTTNP